MSAATSTTTEKLVERPRATTAVARLGHGGVALPEMIWGAAGLKDGDTLLFEVHDDEDGFRIEVIPIDPDQAWGWTPESLAAIREAKAAIREGRHGTIYSSTEEFLAALERRSHDADLPR